MILDSLEIFSWTIGSIALAVSLVALIITIISYYKSKKEVENQILNYNKKREEILKNKENIDKNEEKSDKNTQNIDKNS